MNIGLITRCCASAIAVAQALTLAASAAKKAVALSTFGKLPIKEMVIGKEARCVCPLKLAQGARFGVVHLRNWERVLALRLRLGRWSDGGKLESF